MLVTLKRTNERRVSRADSHALANARMGTRQLVRQRERETESLPVRKRDQPTHMHDVANSWMWKVQHPGECDRSIVHV